MAAPQDLERKLGYRFVRPDLLRQALTHRSFGTPHNERLEFLGDSVLNCAVAEILFQLHADMPEGDLSRLRAGLVNQASLAEIAHEIGVSAHLRLGEGEIKTGGANRPSILADAVEALLGGVFLDAGFAAARDVVRTLFEVRLGQARGATPAKDAKTALQEWLQARRMALPRYEIMRIEGEAHKQIFEVRCDVDDLRLTASGRGASRRTAEQSAAAQILTQLPEDKTK